MDFTSATAAASSGDAAGDAWDWGSLLDFALDEQDPLLLPWDEPPPSPPHPIPAQPSPPAPSPSRVRKRDPRLVCENYLAGRVPCACPEIDEQERELEAEDAKAEAAAGGRKRQRAGAGAAVRCQVAGCEADIGELKGYHKRHRVCLQCANAASVVVDGESKRYCQQCGKFHILPDFDEGKRSCRRKLERHNKRRRRRPTDNNNLVEKEKDPQGDWSPETTCGGEPRKDVLNRLVCETVETVVSNKSTDREILFESEDGHGSPICSLPDSQNVENNNAPFAPSNGKSTDEKTDNAKSALSSTICDNKSDYSSVCPTGRISFKLYDWNPAEFPRRLRHEIFQWLSSMPVELEGYIRPGCTILTIFIAMPQFMWDKLHEDVALYVQNLVNAPGSSFSGRDNFLMYLSNKIVQILKVCADGTSLMNIKMEVKVPQLHYVYPTFFEAGKPIEFFACGINLDQPKFRFLVSFAGKYLVYDSCHAIAHGNIISHNGNRRDSSENFGHEMFRINITQTSSEVFGPAFVEVENEAGLSNFVPILFGNKHICSDLKRLQDTFSVALAANKSQIAASCSSPVSCEDLVLKQAAMSQLVMDIAWLLKNPGLDINGFFLSSINIKRLTCLVEYSLNNKLVSVLEAIQHYFDNMAGGRRLVKPVNMYSEIELDILLKYMTRARDFLYVRTSPSQGSEVQLKDSIHTLPMVQNYVNGEAVCLVSWTNQDVESRSRGSLVLTNASTSPFVEEDIALVDKQIIHRQKCCPHPGFRWPKDDSWSNIFPWKAVTGTQLSAFLMLSVVMCFAACIVLLHPHKAGGFAVSIRRGLFGAPLT